MQTEAGEIAGWLRLTQTEGLGPQSLRKLLAAFGLPQQILETGLPQLGRHIPERVARALRTAPGEDLQNLIEATQTWAQQPGNHFLTLADPRYPSRLLEIADPPPVLYVKGNPGLLNAPAMAVVGSRNATAQGLENAERFAANLAQAGWTIVSGLALGIDTAAHRGALTGPGSTIAVIGTGADIVYPARNRDLAHRLAAGGAIVTEFPLGTPPMAHHFPRRNRIISGLARGVLVVEAAAQSGSLITARLAAEQGREVFAIPGSIHSPLAKGCHRLIKEGAKLVESAQDILEELGAGGAARHACPVGPAKPTAEPDPILDALGHDPALPDQIAVRTGLDIATISTRLLELELEGLVVRAPGGTYQRLADA